MKEKLEFEDFSDFCSRADEILEEFKRRVESGELNISKYRKYIYDEHTFCNNELMDMTAKDKCWQWLMSYEYEPMDKNDLFCILGIITKENKL